MRKLINLSASFIAGLGLSTLISLSLLSLPWEFWIVAIFIGFAIAAMGWSLDDALMAWLNLHPITYYGCFFVAVTCAILGLGVSVWLVSLGAF
jgi:hypothetical protein